MKNLDIEELIALLDSLDDEQALLEERAFITSRLSKLYEDHALEIEHDKKEVRTLLARLVDAEQVYGRGCQS